MEMRAADARARPPYGAMLFHLARVFHETDADAPSLCPILELCSILPTAIMEKMWANLEMVLSMIAALPGRGHHHITSETHFGASSKCNVILISCSLSPSLALVRARTTWTILR